MSQDKQRKKRGKFSLSSLQYVLQHVIWPRRKLVIFGVILIIVNRFSRLVLPGSTKYLMDDVIGKGDTELLEILLLSVGAALFVQAVTSFVLTRLLSVEAQHMISILRVDVQRHVIQLPVRYFDNTKSGELVSRIMLDVEGVRNLIGTGLVQMFGGILTSVVVFVLLLDLNPLLTLYVVAPLALFGLISLKAFGYVRPIFRERAKVNADVTGRLTESLGGIRVIKGFNAERSEVAIFKKGVERIFDNVKKTPHRHQPGHQRRHPADRVAGGQHHVAGRIDGGREPDDPRRPDGFHRLPGLPGGAPDRNGEYRESIHRGLRRPGPHQGADERPQGERKSPSHPSVGGCEGEPGLQGGPLLLPGGRRSSQRHLLRGSSGVGHGPGGQLGFRQDHHRRTGRQFPDAGQGRGGSGRHRPLPG